VENLPPDFLGGSVAEVEYMLAGLDASVAGLCLDTGHAMMGREAPVDYVRALGSRIFGIHWHTNDGSSDAHLLPDVHHGEWDDFFAALDEVGCRAPVTLEVDFPAATPLEEALRAVCAAVQGRLAP
jgi:sugar phosphate isomerase/epimerase